MRASLFIFCLFFGSTVAVAQTGFVAGYRPAERPANAPVLLVSPAQSASWQADAGRGLPANLSGLEFLKDHGSWYTPFNQPNMPGRYDLRQLHRINQKD